MGAFTTYTAAKEGLGGPEREAECAGMSERLETWRATSPQSLAGGRGEIPRLPAH